jgi:hypothetical protein
MIASLDRFDYGRKLKVPFGKVRYFCYFNIAGGTTTSLLISVSRIVAAVVADVKAYLLDESVRNALIDVTGLNGGGVSLETRSSIRNITIETCYHG